VERTVSTDHKVLIVDDDPHIREVVRFALQKAGYHTVEAADGRAALARFTETRPDLVVLDILMPELDGTEVCRQIRAQSRVPIVFLSSRDEEVDRIVGLELGGDDYLTKPFSPRELVARVRAVLRRTVPPPPGEEPGAGEASRPTGQVTHGQLTLDLDRFVARWGEAEVVLTVTEFGLLRTLMRYPGKVYSRDELMAHAYEGLHVVTDRTIDSHVRRVRRKFAQAGAADLIETVHGVGYRLGDCLAG
jgi:two-component system OmpR family response regulator